MVLSLIAAPWPSANQAITNDAAEFEAALASKRDPLALARVYRLWNTGVLVDDAPAVGRVLEKIAPRLAPLPRAHADHLLGRIALSAGDDTRAEAIANKLGLATAGWLLGPFDNSAGRGHATTFDVETVVDLDATLPGKGHLIRWRRFDGLAPYGEIALSDLIFPSTDASAFVLVTFSLPNRVRAAVRVGSTDATRVFIDGALVFEEDLHRQAALDQINVPVELSAGLHTVLVKSSWAGDSARVLIRVTQADGRPIDGLQYVSAPATVAATTAQPASSSLGRHRIVAVTDAIDRATRTSPTAAQLSLRSDLFAMLSLYDREKLPTIPEQDLKRAIEIDPNDPRLRFFYAHRVEPRDRALAREHLEAALALDPGYAPAELKLAEQARRAGRPLDARRRLERAVAIDPGLAHAQAALASIRFDNPYEQHQALAALDAIDDPTVEILAAKSAHRAAISDPVGAADAARATLAIDHRRMDARRRLIAAAERAGDVEGALKLIRGAISLAPWAVRHQMHEARLLAGAGRRAEALATLERAAKRFPDHNAIYDLAAEYSLLQGDKAGALAMVERSLMIDPQRPTVRRRRSKLAGEETEIEDEFTVDLQPYLRLPADDAEKSWGASHLVDRMAVRLYDNGQTTRFHQYAVRIFNPKLDRAFQVRSIAYSPSREVVEVLTAERIRPNGEVVRASRIGDRGPSGKVSGMYVDQRSKVIQFDQLDKGDVVHLRYRVDSIGQNIFGGFFGDIRFLQSRVPKRNVLYTVTTPDSRPLYPAHVRAPAPTVERKDGLQTVTWAFDTVDALDTEPASPPYPQQGMLLSVSTYKSWDELGSWYAGLIESQAELDDEAREAGRRAVEGANDDAEKIRRLYNYVVKNTRYVGIELGIHGWKPFKASEVHRRRYGDCKDKATLLAALLRDNGIDATLALVRTRDRGRFPDDHATMWAFNHAITYVPSANLFLDGTAEFSGSRELPYLDQGAMSLIVHTDGRTELLTPMDSTAHDNRNLSSYEAQLGADGSIVLEGEERFYGARASKIRREYQEQKTRKDKLERLLSSALPGGRIASLDFSKLDDLEQPPSYRYEIRSAKYVQPMGDKLIVPLTLFRHQVAKAYATLPKRVQDLYVQYAWTTTNRVRYVLPKGLAIGELPKGESIDGPYISLKQRIEAVEGGFEVEDTVTLKARIVPAKDYDAFRADCLAIDRALDRKVVLRSGS